MADDVNAVMQTIPANWRAHWCEADVCACMGCVQVGNRLIMVGKKAHQVDPEKIDERKIPADVFKRYKVTKDEWVKWVAASHNSN